MTTIRSRFFIGVIILTSLIFIGKLFFIQVVDSQYATLASQNAVRRIVDYPLRGLIYDRNNNLIVYNTPEYSLFLTRQEMTHFDSAKFCDLFSLSSKELRLLFKKMEARPEYARFKPTLFLSKLSKENMAKAFDKMDEFSGFFIQSKTTRAYTAPIAANALGYVSEITPAQLAQDTLHFYKPGDYIGQSGIESFYEKELRGVPGVRFEITDVKGVSKGSFKNGSFDTLSIPGKNIYSTLDLNLQKYGEKLMDKKIGSIICLEPSTGEILAFVSAPGYDPNLLTGKKYSANFLTLNTDSLKPFFNRPLMAQYRPGSIFKIAQALVGLQQNIIQVNTRIVCDRTIIGCHGQHTREDLPGAISNSCNVYFYLTLQRLLLQSYFTNPYEDTRYGLRTWNSYIRSFGFGNSLGIDIPNEKRGLIPTVAYYDKAYHNRPWKFSNIYSIAIGEGEILVTPIQMVNFAAIVANQGHYITPHLVKGIGKEKKVLRKYQEKHITLIDSIHFQSIQDAMQHVVEHGTGRRSQIRDIVVCGKTGTVQNTPPIEDHSVFIAFAPRSDPQIAVSVYVENAGQGGRAAASIASLMIEKYLSGRIRRLYTENYVFAGDFFD